MLKKKPDKSTSLPCCGKFMNIYKSKLLFTGNLDEVTTDNNNMDHELPCSSQQARARLVHIYQYINGMYENALKGAQYYNHINNLKYTYIYLNPVSKNDTRLQ